MRILHSSDWHLGRSLHGVDLLDHQAAYLDHLVALARTERVSAVVVAGDVYDRALPPVRAVELLSETLARLAEVTQVVMSPGNHDSATRLGFGAAVMRPEVHLRASLGGVGEPVVLGDDDGEAWVYALPYLDPDASRRELSPDPSDPEQDLPRSHEAVMSAALGRVRADVAARRAAGGNGRVVVAAHAFVVGGQASESERDIRVGGIDSVPAGVFEGADYVALGHLHGPQQVSGAGGAVARYAGSPLAYSFSEVNHHKSTALVTLGGEGPAQVELVEAPVPRPLADLTGSLEELLSAKHDAHADSWVRVTVTDPVRPGDLQRRLESRFSHLLVCRHQPAGGQIGRANLRVVTAASDPVSVVGDFVRHVTGRDASEGESEVLRAAVEAVAVAERSA